MADRDPGQPPVAFVAELLKLTPTDVPDRRPGQVLVQAVGLGQQGHILGGVMAPIRLAGCAPAVADLSGLAALRDQPGQLRPRQSGGLAQVRLERPLVGLAQMRVVKLLVRGFDEAVGIAAGHRLQVERVVAGGEVAQVLQGPNA